jgi:hypothetical protein
MEIDNIKKYLGKRVFLILKSGYKYKCYLEKNSLTGTTLSFKDKFDYDVDIDISEISYISIAREEMGKEN